MPRKKALKPAQIAELLEDRKSGLSYRALSKKWHLSRSTIWQYCRIISPAPTIQAGMDSADSRAYDKIREIFDSFTESTHFVNMPDPTPQEIKTHTTPFSAV